MEALSEGGHGVFEGVGPLQLHQRASTSALPSSFAETIYQSEWNQAVLPTLDIFRGKLSPTTCYSSAAPFILLAISGVHAVSTSFSLEQTLKL